MAGGIGQWVGGLISNMWKPRQVGGVWFYPINNDSWKALDYLNNFSEIPELNAVINYKARAFSSGRINKIDKDGNKLPDDEIVKLLRKPNWFQAEKEFLRQTKVFREIFGNEYLYSWFGVGYKPINTRALYTLPPNLVETEYNQTVPFFMNEDAPDTVKYVYKADISKDMPLPIEQLIHMNDNRVNVTEKTKKKFLEGESKMVGLRPAINNLRMAYETRGVILKRRGALGIMSNAGADVSGQLPLQKKERDNIQRQYSQYGGLESQDNIIITNANLKWQQMTVSPDKLGLFTETFEDFCKICDGYGVRHELFASAKGTTYENQNQARKDLYSNTVIPEANEWIGAVSSYYYGEESTDRLMMDYSSLDVFQTDLAAHGTAVGAIVTAMSKAYADKVITAEEYQKELNKYGVAVGLAK
jgi:phage portal protein BeeE